MSEQGVHVPHEGHGSFHGGDAGLGRWIAVFTALVATLGALIGHRAEEIAKDAILLKNEAVLKKTEAADRWAYYQAVSTKSHLAELAMTLVAEDKRAPFADKISKYAQQKGETKAQAEKLEAASAKADAESAALASPRARFMYALALLQVAISVGSVTMLTGQRWLFGVALAGALVGLIMAGLALLAP